MSLELGIPAHELKHIIPHRELVLYEAYAVKRMLPNKRIEMHLAQIAFMIGKSGGSQAEFSDYLFEVKEEIESLHDYFEFKPIRKK